MPSWLNSIDNVPHGQVNSDSLDSDRLVYSIIKHKDSADNISKDTDKLVKTLGNSNSVVDFAVKDFGKNDKLVKQTLFSITRFKVSERTLGCCFTGRLHRCTSNLKVL